MEMLMAETGLGPIVQDELWRQEIKLLCKMEH